MNTTRRTFLASAGMSLLAHQASAQMLRRQPLPNWYQVNRVRGMSWQNQVCTSLFFSKPKRRILVSKWAFTGQLLLRLYYVPDPNLDMMERMFRLYEVRSTQDLDSNPKQVEDIAWPGPYMTQEKLWTSFYSNTSEMWSEITDETREDRTEFYVPSMTPILWIQPTNDTPGKDQDPDLDLSEDTLLGSTMLEMLQTKMFVAGVNTELKDVKKPLSDKNKNLYLAKMPAAQNAPHTHLYFRVFSSALPKLTEQ